MYPCVVQWGSGHDGVYVVFLWFGFVNVGRVDPDDKTLW